MGGGDTAGINVVGIIPVGLFGQPADMSAINQFANQHNLWVLDDAAQSLGAERQGQRVGQMAKAGFQFRYQLLEENNTSQAIGMLW